MSEAEENQMTIADALEAAPEKPKRGRPRKKAADAPVPAADAGAAEVPAKRTTRRTAKAAADAPVDEAPKPRRARTHKADADAALAEAPAAEEAPKPRRTRKKADAAASAPAETAAPEAASEAAPADAAPAKKDGERKTTVVRKHARGERPENEGRTERRERNSGPGKGQNQGGKKNSNNHDRNNRRQRHENRNREPQPSVTKEELAELKVADLRARGAELGVDGAGLKKAELVDAIYEATCKAEGFTEVTGVLDIMPDGYGFLRTPKNTSI